jgi:hypothetical protein
LCACAALGAAWWVGAAARAAGPGGANKKGLTVVED